MGIVVTSSFDPNAQLPLDSRTKVADITARDAIVSGVRYEGLTVYVLSTKKNYQLKGGILNANWEEVGSAGGSSIGPFTINQNTSGNLTGEVYSSAATTMVDYVLRIKRGTTVYARIEFSIIYRNGNWEMADASVRRGDGSNATGFTPTVDNVTGQVGGTVDNDGAGNATIDGSKVVWGP